MLKKVKSFWMAHAADIKETLCFTGGSVFLISLVMFARIAMYVA